VLSEVQVQKLIDRLEQGPAAAGWNEDQRWTLARVRTLIGRMFHITVGTATVWETLRRAGCTPQHRSTGPPNATSRPSNISSGTSGPR
jgi:transposase